MVVLSKRATGRILPLIYLASFLIGCTPSLSSKNNVANNHNVNKQYTLNQADKLLQLASDSNDQQAVSLQLQAIEQLLIAENPERAEYVLQENLKNASLDKYNHAFKQILYAKLALAKRNITEANQRLTAIAAPEQLPEDLLIKFYATKAEIYQRSDNFLSAAKTRIYLSKYIQTPTDKAVNNKIILDLLLQITPSTLKSLANNQEKSELNGWLQFASINKQYDSSSEQMHSALKSWQLKYSGHPALTFIPEHAEKLKADTIDTNTIIATTTPKQIALMLPLQGNHEKSAKAVRDGFLAAYYANKNNTNRPKIQVYDTTLNSDLATLYRQVLADGADFIVGPLTKEEVDAISNAVRPQVPMLTLNSSSKANLPENILQFSLSPELEAQAVAHKAWLDGHRNAIVIIPKSVWGNRMQSAFEKAWSTMGGKIVDVQKIEAQTDITNGVKRILAIDKSEDRAQTIKNLGIKFSFDPRRRQDIDMVFIATNAALARQVKPLLNFYFAANVPAYASSSVFTGKIQPSLDQDLNGIQFCDMPWILDQENTHSTYNTIAELWSEDFEQYTRLYALGLDAYKVALQLKQLNAMPDLGISGMTGMLTLEQQQTISRKLIWASFKKGRPYVNGEKS